MPNDSFIQKILLAPKYQLELEIFRLDLLHPDIEGNKFFKLLYNVELAKELNLPIITLGGAHSNHIVATALACHNEGMTCYGIIRGTNFSYLSPSLQRAKALGMHLIFSEREEYRTIRDENSLDKHTKLFLDQGVDFPKKYHFVPEGGTNELGIKGAEDILDNLQLNYDYIFCPVGTGGTLSGLINFLKGEKKLVGISSLKDDYLIDQIREYTKDKYENWQLNFHYHFGGYAKWNMDLIDFINQFKKEHGIPLCPIYTGKMMFGIYDLIENHYFPPNSKILAIHTGGIQGIEGFNKVNKNIID